MRKVFPTYLASESNPRRQKYRVKRLAELRNSSRDGSPEKEGRNNSVESEPAQQTGGLVKDENSNGLKLDNLKPNSQITKTLFVSSGFFYATVSFAPKSMSLP